MATIDEFIAGFGEEPGYLDFASVGPLGRAAIEEEQAQVELLRRARFGSLASLGGQDSRVRQAVGRLIAFSPERVVFQPSAASGLMHAMFGITGGVLLSAAEFPALPFAVVRAADSLSVLAPGWLDTADGPVTPGVIRDRLTPSIVAVAVSLVDFRTGYLADIDGIRQVIGDRLLIVDATQGFGIVDAPFALADVIVSGGQAWARAGWGTGFLALSDRAIERLTPVFSGYSASARGRRLQHRQPESGRPGQVRRGPRGHRRGGGSRDRGPPRREGVAGHRSRRRIRGAGGILPSGERARRNRRARTRARPAHHAHGIPLQSRCLGDSARRNGACQPACLDR